jgi:diguanylate cyclase (GGDEF)-like protein/PAS domain S-box-containing protein
MGEVLVKGLRSRTTFEKSAFLCVVIVSVISLLAISGWVSNRLVLASFNSGFIPMAPSTALIFLGLCLYWMAVVFFQSGNNIRILVRVALLLMMIVVIFITIRYFTGIGPDLERWFDSPAGLSGEFSAGRMSPLTGLVFLLLIPALLLIPGRGLFPDSDKLVVSLSLVVFLLSSLNLLGYIFGAPPFYGGTIIPVAISTALSFWFFSLGLILTSGPTCWLTRVFTGSGLKARLMRIFIPTTVGIVLFQGIISNATDHWITLHALNVAMAVVIALFTVILVISLISKNISEVYERSDQAQTLQEAVYKIAGAVETTKSMDELYVKIHQIISSVMPAENFYITLYDKVKDLLQFPYFKDAADEPFVGGIQPGKGLTAYILRTGKSLLCTQEVHDELERQGEIKLLGVPSAIWLGVPLSIDGNPIGAMVVQHYSDPKAYGKREQHMLEFVSTQVAIVINRKRAEEALRQSETELRALFASMHDVVLVIDNEGVYRKIAPTNPGLLVKPPEDLLNKALRDVFEPEQAETFLKVVQQVLETKQTSSIEYALIINDRTVWFETSISPMTDDTTLWVAHDITQRKRYEMVQNVIFRITQAAITSEGIENLYQTIHSLLGELIPTDNFYIALYDPHSRLINFPYYIDQFDDQPPTPMQLQGLTGYVIRTGKPLLATREQINKLIQKGEVELVGTLGVDWLGAPLIVEGNVMGVMAVQSYVEEIHFDQDDMNLLEFVSSQVAQAIERKRSDEALQSLSLTDELTGLYNRRGFTILADQQMKQAHRMKSRMLLLFGDVDSLKTINDTLGHPQGDLALKELAAILKNTFREVDILARLGGDEFLVLAPDASRESLDVLISRLQAVLFERNQKGDRPYQLTLSVGIGSYDPENPCTLGELITQADDLMYKQKHPGMRNMNNVGIIPTE